MGGDRGVSVGTACHTQKKKKPEYKIVKTCLNRKRNEIRDKKYSGMHEIAPFLQIFSAPPPSMLNFAAPIEKGWLRLFNDRRITLFFFISNKICHQLCDFLYDDLQGLIYLEMN